MASGRLFGTLSSLRELLQSEGCAPPPWCSSGQVLERFHGLLHERLDDDAFWGRLKEFAKELQAGHGPRLLPPGEDVLGVCLTPDVIDELRASLDAPETPGSRLSTWLDGQLGPSALVVFLTLSSLATSGCGHVPSCDRLAKKYDIDAGEDKDVMCDLRRIVVESDLSNRHARKVLKCLARRSSYSRSYWLTQWQDASEEEINRDLDWLLEDCTDNDDDDSGH